MLSHNINIINIIKYFKKLLKPKIQTILKSKIKLKTLLKSADINNVYKLVCSH